MLYHIVARSDWEQAQRDGRYAPDGFVVEGFIHLSRAGQILRPAELLYRGRDDLVLLEIDPTRVRAQVVDEPGSHGEDELFPHLYGVLNLDAVERIIAFPCRADGGFDLPAELVDRPG